ncbi:hypothetical protein CSW64_00430 [Caulobacter mirabilis]|uniref:LPS-assembly lipoprotein n=1 Tax=Caulobacter mirabilis TaxID=69666 RepID=A0A2D2B3L3_9CAUL|nr:hypothetical protein CSW64_00430 [Caulobacter mirabilis]
MLALALLTLAAPGLSACGFTPLYAQPGVSSGLSGIETVAPDGRAGYLLREALDDALARDRALPPIYRLQIDLKQVRTARGRRVDSAASRYELVFQADWKLVDAKTGGVAREGHAETEVSYDRGEQPYAAISASQDAEQRAASELARKIQLQLADWMARGQAG